MLVSMPCFCSASQARMPSQVDAIWGTKAQDQVQSRHFCCRRRQEHFGLTDKCVRENSP